jgi:hypothetical protein
VFGFHANKQLNVLKTYWQCIRNGGGKVEKMDRVSAPPPHQGCITL